MHGDNVIDLWHELHKKQTDWAFRGYGRLIQTLSEDVQEKLSLKDEVTQSYVVIFGKTQVGKTTLLLDLMGIASEQMPIISEIMRGGREQGKSATATAMEYRASMGENWGLTSPGKSYPELLNSDQAMKNALGRIRKEMEEGQLVAETPCVVHIPKRFFDTAHSNTPNVRILDLPGDNPANEQEQMHVNQMAKTYLPFADLILLVGKGDDLSFLRPDVITLPGIEDWQAMPHRFRIVTTYSYTAQSVKDILRNDDSIDEGALRRRLIQEIERFGVLSEVARTESLYFPLEFGDSWTGVKSTEPDLYQRMSPIIIRLRAELLDQIQRATTPMGRLRNTLSTHHSVKYFHKKKTEAIEALIQQHVSKGNKVSQELSTWDKAIELANAKLCKIEEVLTSQDLQANQLLIKRAAYAPIYTSALRFPPELKGPKDYVSTLKKLVFDYYAILPTLDLEVSSPSDSTTSRPYWIKIRKNLAVTESRFIHDVMDENFGSIRIALSKYWFDTYFYSDNFKKDLKLVHDAGRATRNALIEHKKGAWLSALRKVHDDHLADQRAIETDIALKKADRDRSRHQQLRINEELHNLHAELDHFKQTSAEDMERCKRFDQLLAEEYLHELNEKMTFVCNATSDDYDVLLQLLSCMELKYQYEDLVQLNELGTI